LAAVLTILGISAVLPASARAQAPPYLTQWGTLGNGDGQFVYPYGVATDAAGNVYVTDSGNHRIQKFTSSGTYLTQWGTQGSGDGQFDGPSGVATDAAGNVYIVDTYNYRIQKFTSSGTYLTQWGTFGDGDGQFYGTNYGVATDAAGNVYVVDRELSRVQKFTNTGQFIMKWGTIGHGDGQFFGPEGVATDAAGNVYVADNRYVWEETINNRIQKFTSTGTYLTQWGSSGSGDGQFNVPFGVATDAAGNVYVADIGNHRIQEFTSTGTYLTQWGSLGDGNGQFHGPGGIGVATDGAGNVYVADGGNHRIQKFGPLTTPTIAMAFDFVPNVLILGGRGSPWVTGFLEPAAPYAASDIDISSIRLNGTVPVDPATPTALGDHDGNGVPDLMVKFNRPAVELTVSEGDNVPVNITGTVDGHSFLGTDYIRVRRYVVSASLVGSHLTAGSVAARPGELALTIRGVTPNPAAGGRVWVEFTLRDGSPARLEMADVAGRVLTSRQVGTLGPGVHALDLSEGGGIRPGIYFLRLTQDGSVVRARAAVIK
jgi:hypothetical protein